MLASDHAIALLPACVAVGLVQLRRVRSEAHVWVALLGTLLLAAAVQPGALSVTALLSAAALLLRAFAPRITPTSEPGEPPAATAPYRAGVGVVADVLPVVTLDGAERARAVVGSAFGVYLAAWSSRWSAGPFPAHVVLLDVILTIAVLFAVWRMRVRSPLAPLAFTWGHLVVESRLIPVPSGAIAWGETIVTVGFALLAGSLAVSVFLRPRHPGSVAP
jgi:hypothetical protein